MQKKSLKYLIGVGCLCMLSMMPLLGAGRFRPIRASINREHRYVVNGKEVLRTAPIIRYDDQYYVPIKLLDRALGYEAKSNNDETTFTSRTSSTPTPTPTTRPSQNTVTLDNAVIIAIDLDSSEITVYPADKPNTEQYQINLRITPTTIITNDTDIPRFNINDLNTDMVVKVTYSAAMTKSIPPTANAVKIVAPLSSIQPR